jgi:2-hydroxychromene-2-carboxylate isomerase
LADLEIHRAGTDAPAGPAFYFDVASPEAYLAAERILSTMPVPCEWIPVRAADLADGVGPVDRAVIERRAAALGLQAVVWPATVPFDSDLAQRTATYAKSIGRVVAFGLAAFRQAYAAGRDLTQPDNVVIAGAACEMHPNAILRTVETRGVRRALDDATALAAERGVRTVPAVWTGREALHGEALLDHAAAALAE